MISFAFVSTSQTADKKWSVGLHGGFNQYWGDLGHCFYNFNQPFYGFGGLSVGRYINRWFDASLEADYGSIGHSKFNEEGFNASMLNANLNFRFKFLGKDEAKFVPYIFVGLGYMNFNDKRSDNSWNNFALPTAGIGVQYHVTPSIAIQIQGKYIYSNYDKVDYAQGKADDSYLQHSIGVVFNFGKMKDTDKDGIPDRKDKCPTVAGLIKFEGCPDSDNDGVVDANDKCPNTPANVKVDANGCPVDTDGDGIADYMDKCPEVKGLAKLDGCPDADNDGVADNDDKCPNTPAGVKVDKKGCPLDTDGDGVADYLDDCPTVKGLVSLKGCPDRDGDGIADKDDKCPDVKGTVENKGCPEVKAEVKEVFKKALQGIQFETGKDIIRPVSFKILDNVVNIMKENKEYNLVINGHTDNVGKADANMILSQKRATAVQNYLISKGVEASRLKSFGFGDTKPVDDNKTPAGRAKNRRVEFVVEF